MTQSRDTRTIINEKFRVLYDVEVFLLGQPDSVVLLLKKKKQFPLTGLVKGCKYGLRVEDGGATWKRATEPITNTEMIRVL